MTEEPVKTFKILDFPNTKWKWDFLGDGGSLMFHLNYEVSWLKRVITRIVLGSKWTCVKENTYEKD